MSYALKNALSLSENQQKENIFGSHKLEKDRHGMYVLSNQIRNYGASCIIYPSIAERIGRILEADYYIIPSSVHELIIIPAEGSSPASASSSLPSWPQNVPMLYTWVILDVIQVSRFLSFLGVPSSPR